MKAGLHGARPYPCLLSLNWLVEFVNPATWQVWAGNQQQALATTNNSSRLPPNPMHLNVVLAKELNFSAADTIAFGDNLNDLPMLNWAGTSVAMANAHPDVLATTAIKTLSNAQVGVAVKIEQMLAGS